MPELYKIGFIAYQRNMQTNCTKKHLRGKFGYQDGEILLPLAVHLGERLRGLIVSESGG